MSGTAPTTPASTVAGRRNTTAFMDRSRLVSAVPRLALAGCLAGTGYIHADLYIRGYVAIPVVGPAFLLQAAGSFAVALLLLTGGSAVLRLAAAGLAAGALVGFVASRTVGISGFVERGLNPAPQSLISVLLEVAVLLLVGISVLPPLVARVRSGHVVSARGGRVRRPPRTTRF